MFGAVGRERLALLRTSLPSATVAITARTRLVTFRTSGPPLSVGLTSGGFGGALSIAGYLVCMTTAAAVPRRQLRTLPTALGGGLLAVVVAVGGLLWHRWEMAVHTSPVLPQGKSIDSMLLPGPDAAVVMLSAYPSGVYVSCRHGHQVALIADQHNVRLTRVWAQEGERDIYFVHPDDARLFAGAAVARYAVDDTLFTLEPDACWFLSSNAPK